MREGTVQPCGEEIRRRRIERGWSQEQLAEAAGCTKRTIENAESGKPVYVHTIGAIAASLKNVETSDLIHKIETKPSDQSPIRNEPRGNAPTLPSLLVGRQSDIANLIRRLTRHLGNKDVSATKALVVVRGWPGVGKTTLARAIAHSPELALAFPDGVLWAALGPAPQILSEILAWGRSLGEESILHCKDVAEASHRVAGLLRSRRMLLIIDDAWDVSHVQPFEVGGRECAMLVTTRLTSVADALAPSPGDIYHLDVLSADDSLALLHTLAPSVVDGHHEECRDLVHELEGLPLALQVAGRLLRAEQARGWSVRELLAELRRDVSRLLNAQAPADTAASPGEVSPTVAALLRKSTDCLDAATRKQFAYLAPFAPRPATFELEDIMSVWKTSEANTRQAIDTLVDRGLLEPLGDGDYQIHQVLVQHANLLLKELKKR